MSKEKNHKRVTHPLLVRLRMIRMILTKKNIIQIHTIQDPNSPDDPLAFRLHYSTRTDFNGHTEAKIVGSVSATIMANYSKQLNV